MFEFVGDPQLMQVHVFTTSRWKGTVTESDGRYFGGLSFLNNNLLYIMQARFKMMSIDEWFGRSRIGLGGRGYVCQVDERFGRSRIGLGGRGEVWEVEERFGRSRRGFRGGECLRIVPSLLCVIQPD